jgi:hypothetical protein
MITSDNLERLEYAREIPKVCFPGPGCTWFPPEVVSAVMGNMVHKRKRKLQDRDLMPPTDEAPPENDVHWQLLLPTVATDSEHAPFLDMLAGHLNAMASLRSKDEICEHSSSVNALFHASKSPAISIEAYLMRLARFTSCSSVCFLYAFSYIRRVMEHIHVCGRTAHRYGAVHLSLVCKQVDAACNRSKVVDARMAHCLVAHACPVILMVPSAQGVVTLGAYLRVDNADRGCRLILASLSLAVKLVDDTHCTNTYYAKVGGIPLELLNKLELQLFILLSFQLSTPVHSLLHLLTSVRLVTARCFRIIVGLPQVTRRDTLLLLARYRI